jgi:hypothetical protein
MSNITSTVRAKLVTATTPTVYNLSMPLAATEYSQLLATGTKRVLIRMRNKAKAQVAFVSGNSGLLYFTIEAGAVYFEENLDLSSVTIYLQSNIPAQVAEIIEWA